MLAMRHLTEEILMKEEVGHNNTLPLCEGGNDAINNNSHTFSISTIGWL